MGDCLRNGCIMSIHKCLGGVILIAAIGGLKFYATHIVRKCSADVALTRRTM